MVTLTRRKTKTWKDRHEDKISRLVQQAMAWRIEDPVVIEVGPGGIAKKYADRFPVGPESKMSFLDRKRLQLISVPESRERDKPDVELITHETLELYRSLKNSVGLKAMYVVEIDEKVVEAVRKLDLKEVVVLHQDITGSKVYHEGKLIEADMGVMYRVAEYLGDRYNMGLASLMGSVKKERGLIGMTLPKNRSEIVPPGLTLLSPDVYLNGERRDKQKWTSGRRPSLNEGEIIARAMDVEGPYAHHI